MVFLILDQSKYCVCTPVSLQGELYIKESDSYFCPHCGKLVKIGITRNFIQRDKKYKATELPHQITTSARLSVSGWDMNEFDKYIKEILVENGHHCSHGKGGTEFYTVKGAQILLSLLGKIYLVQAIEMIEEYKKFYKGIIFKEEWQDFQIRML